MVPVSCFISFYCGWFWLVDLLKLKPDLQVPGVYAPSVAWHKWGYPVIRSKYIRKSWKKHNLIPGNQQFSKYIIHGQSFFNINLLRLNELSREKTSCIMVYKVQTQGCLGFNSGIFLIFFLDEWLWSISNYIAKSLCVDISILENADAFFFTRNSSVSSLVFFCLGTVLAKLEGEIWLCNLLTSNDDKVQSANGCQANRQQGRV